MCDALRTIALLKGLVAFKLSLGLSPVAACNRWFGIRRRERLTVVQSSDELSCFEVNQYEARFAFTEEEVPGSWGRVNDFALKKPRREDPTYENRPQQWKDQ